MAHDLGMPAGTRKSPWWKMEQPQTYQVAFKTGPIGFIINHTIEATNVAEAVQTINTEARRNYRLGHVIRVKDMHGHTLYSKKPRRRFKLIGWV